MKIYTRSGDAGKTSLFGGRRVSKAHLRVRAYGTVDELNASLGVAAVAIEDEELRQGVARLQSRLFDIGADLATPPDGATSQHVVRARPEWTAALEADIDAMEAMLEPLRTFILPAGCAGSAALHLSRTICRRAERRVILARESGEDMTDEALRFLNRLSDWLFVAARTANAGAGVADVAWTPDRAASAHPADRVGEALDDDLDKGGVL